MRHRWITITAAIVAFGASLFGMGFVQQQFFPASNCPELPVTMTLLKNASIAATEAETERPEKALAGDPDIAHFSSYVGGGAIRFYLPLDVQLTTTSWPRRRLSPTISKRVTEFRPNLRPCSPTTFLTLPLAFRGWSWGPPSVGPCSIA